MPQLPKIAFGVGKVSGASAPGLANWGLDERDSLCRERLVDCINILNTDAQQHPMTRLITQRKRFLSDHIRGGRELQQDKILVFQPECERIIVAKCYWETKLIPIEHHALIQVLYEQHGRVDLAHHH